MTWSVAAGTPTAATATPQTPSYPTTVTGGRLYALMWKKPGTANSGTAPSNAGWTLQASLTGGNDGDTGGYGSQDPTVADLGNVNAWIFKRDADADGTESGTVSLAYPAGSSVQGTIIICVSTDVGFDSQATATGKQTSDPSVALAITASGDFSGGTSAGDLVLAFFAAASDNGTFATPLITQTGVTFGATSFVTGTPWMTTQGADGEALAMYASATAGTSAAAPTMAAVTGGTTTNIRGPCVFLRLRETSGGHHDLAGDDLVGSAPTLTAGSLSQAHALASAGITTPDPTVTAGALTQAHTLASAALLTGAPTLTAGTLSQLHALTSGPLTTPAPTLTAGALSQHHALLGADLVTGVPTLSPGSLAGHVDLTGDSIIAGVPTLTAGTLSQLHALAGLGITTPEPLITAGALSQHHAISGGDLVAGVPFLTAGSLGGEIDTTFAFVSATDRPQPIALVSTATRDQPIVLVSIGE